MPQQQNALGTNQECRIDLALQAFRNGQFRRLRHAADTFNVPYSTLKHQNRGRVYRPLAPPKSQKLTLTKEETVVRYILNLNAQGFAPLKAKVRDIINKILSKWGTELVGKC